MIGSILTSPSLYNVAQNTTLQVSINTGLKAVGRPGFILIDGKIDSETKKYSATKEFLYQGACLALSLSMIPIFERHAFRLGRKLFKNEKVFRLFKNQKDFLGYKELTDIQKGTYWELYNKENHTNYRSSDVNADLGKGMITAMKIAGSVMGLSVLSPFITRPLIRPVLKMIGLDKEDKKEQKKSSKIDAKA